MSWQRVNRRHRLVEAVLAAVAETGEAEVPAAFQAEIEAEFGGFGEFLREVQVRWYRAFDARLDAVLEEGPDDMREALAGLWLDLGDAMPAARHLLDTHIDHPALTSLHDRHQRRLHAATGVLTDPPSYRRPPPVSRPCRAHRLTGYRPEGAR